MQGCSSMAVNHQYLPLMGNDQGDVEKNAENDDQADVPQRLAYFILPARHSTNPLKQIDDDGDFPPTKRDSFGRKHHWDAFFG